MAHVIILGAGLGGIPMAYDMKKHLQQSDKLTVISSSDTYQFVPCTVKLTL